MTHQPGFSLFETLIALFFITLMSCFLLKQQWQLTLFLNQSLAVFKRHNEDLNHYELRS